MLGETLLCSKMADFLNIFAALEQGDCETISCTILDSNDDEILLAAVACFLWRRVESSWQFIWAARNFARKRNAAVPLECGKREPHRTIANAQ